MLSTLREECQAVNHGGCAFCREVDPKVPQTEVYGPGYEPRYPRAPAPDAAEPSLKPAWGRFAREGPFNRPMGKHLLPLTSIPVCKRLTGRSTKPPACKLTYRRVRCVSHSSIRCLQLQCSTLIAGVAVHSKLVSVGSEDGEGRIGEVRGGAGGRGAAWRGNAGVDDWDRRRDAINLDERREPPPRAGPVARNVEVGIWPGLAR